MKTEEGNLNRFKGENPFHVPEGYFERLTTDVMERLPRKLPAREVRISWADRVRPWLYMAAVFAGLGFFFKVYLEKQPAQTDSLLVNTDTNAIALSSDVPVSEEEEYMEYLDDLYTDYLWEEESEESE